MNTYTAPRSRKEGLVIEELGDEILIYDTVNDRAHTLNRTAALVWKLCDGKRTVSEIARVAGKELSSLSASKWCGMRLASWTNISCSMRLFPSPRRWRECRAENSLPGLRSRRLSSR